VLLQPKVAGLRVEVKAETIAEPIGEHLMNVGGDLRVLLDLPADFAAGQSTGVEVDVRLASEDVRQLGGKGGVVALGYVPLADDLDADGASERGYHDVVRVRVVERRAEEAEANPRIRSAWGRSVDVGGQQVVAGIGGLRAREIKAGDSDGERQGRHVSIQEERR